jgi:hypothetical protein
MKRTSSNKKVIESTALELGIPNAVVSDIARLYFTMAREDLKTGQMQGTIMMGFGKFVMKDANRGKMLIDSRKKEKKANV